MGGEVEGKGRFIMFFTLFPVIAPVTLDFCEPGRLIDMQNTPRYTPS